MRGVKIAVAGVAIATLLAVSSCSSAGGSSGATSPSPTTSTTSPASEPTEADSSVAETSPAVDLVGACKTLVSVANPATDLSVMTLVDLIGQDALADPSRTPTVGQKDLSTALAALQQASLTGGPTIHDPVGQLGAAILLIQKAMQYKTTVDPQLTYSLITDNIRQIKETCGEAGVVSSS